MNKKLTLGMTMAAACLMMGMSMPSCPGQQAMQQQVDALQAKATEQNQTIQQLNSQVNTMKEEMTQVKTLVAQVSNTVLAQKAALEQMETAMKEQAKAAAARPTPKATARKSLPSKKKR